ncbi:hypothetical protein [Microbacterium sp. LKL04]|uniref:hypothetical protein n=1 Tax=Microbacterium sp. LKL04 TaxID=912630 RepID=UPI0012F7AF26|nr:hypothetical protein [Microbacterium sp. LKL04]
MTGGSVRRMAFSGAIGAAAGIGLAATAVASLNAGVETPWGLMIYGGPIGAGIGAVAGVVVWLLTREAHALARRWGARSVWTGAAAVVAAAGCAVLGYITLEAGVPAVAAAGAVTLGLLAAAGSLTESLVRTRSLPR